MTDYQVSESWWLASDGKWYPPEMHPDHLKSALRSPAPQEYSTQTPPLQNVPQSPAPQTPPRQGPPLLGLEELATMGRDLPEVRWTTKKDRENGAVRDQHTGSTAYVAPMPENWQDKVDRATPKGISSELSGFALFAGSAVVFLLGLGYLAIVVLDHYNLAYMLASPIALLAFYPLWLVRIWQNRQSMAETGTRKHQQYSRVELSWLRTAIATGSIGGLMAVAAFVYFWGYQAYYLLGHGGGS